MSLTPFDYQGHEIRVLNINGEPWWVLNDLCAALGLTRSAPQVAERISDDLRQAYPILDSLGRRQKTTIVSEPGMYEVIIRSDAPAAVPFRRWVTHEVLPQIRKTGSYSPAPALPQSYADALRELASTVDTLEAEKAKVAQLEPSAKAWLHLVDATGDYSVGDAAKILSRDPSIQIGQNTLFRWMDEHGWTYQRSGRHPYQEKVDGQLLTCKANQPYWNGRLGVEVVPAPTIRVTAKGINKLYLALGGKEALLDVTA